MTTMDAKTKTLIGWIATHAWRESWFLGPHPQQYVPMYPLLDEIVRLHDLNPEEVDKAMVEAQEAQEARVAMVEAQEARDAAKEKKT